MPTFSNLDTPNGLAVLNEYLASNSYISGYQPSKADEAVMAAIGTASPSRLAPFPHLVRWHKHIASYTGTERSSWGGSAGCVVISSTESEKKANDAFDADDLFGSDEDDDDDKEAYRQQQERAEAALREKEKRDSAKAAQGKIVVAKSSVLFDVKPWEAETDMSAMEDAVRRIEIDGVTWGASKLAPVGFGIKKLQILATIVDDLVPSTDVIVEQIEAIEDLVQSVDIAAFNKV